MSVIERAIKAYVRFGTCIDCTKFKDEINSVKDLEKNKYSFKKIVEQYNLGEFLLIKDLLSYLNGQRNQEENWKVKMHDLIQFLKEPVKGAVIYEVIKADELSISESCSLKYSEKMDYAEKYVKELAFAMAKPGRQVYIAKAKALSPIVAGRSFLDLAIEYGISWDPVLDLPYIQASEIKGAVRSVLLKLALLSDAPNRIKNIMSVLSFTGKTRGKVFTKEEYKVVNELLTEEEPVVGQEEEHVGWLVISDAYPVNASKGVPVDLFVLTPHYTSDVHQEYDIDPRPIKFVGIPKCTEIAFAVSINKNGVEVLHKLSGTQMSTDQLLKIVLTKALDAGIGRRTSRGMGRIQLEGIEEVRK